MLSSPNKIHRFLSMFLVMLLLFISILQLAHAHKVFAFDKQDISTDAVSAVEKCEICDFIIHKNSTYLPVYLVQNVIVVATKEVSPPCSSYVCDYECTLQAFSNRGPPTVLS